MIDNVPVDLRIKVPSGEYPEITNAWAGLDFDQDTKNGKNGALGTINVQTKKGIAGSGKHTFEFCFVKENTEETLTAIQFEFTIYDLDERGNSKPRIKVTS